MESFSILNSRKRAVIALVHTVIFLTVAGIQAAVSHAEPLSVHGSKATSGIILLSIYLVVTTVLLVLLKAADCTKEKVYFALCAGSASFGLVRIVMGDQVLHVNILRVLLLGCAVLVGMLILRTHSVRAQLQTEISGD